MKVNFTIFKVFFLFLFFSSFFAFSQKGSLSGQRFHGGGDWIGLDGLRWGDPICRKQPQQRERNADNHRQPRRCDEGVGRAGPGISEKPRRRVTAGPWNF